MQCICGKCMDVMAYGFHKCEFCGRIYSCGVNGVAYQGIESWYIISERKETTCKCHNTKGKKYKDPFLKVCHTKKCIKKEVQWLKDNKENFRLLWNGIMTWDERIMQLQDAIGEKHDASE